LGAVALTQCSLEITCSVSTVCRSCTSPSSASKTSELTLEDGAHTHASVCDDRDVFFLDRIAAQVQKLHLHPHNDVGGFIICGATGVLVVPPTTYSKMMRIG
ncbi:hypothetical protein ACLOJK_030900, partial [Asimina triloba]